MQRLVSRMLLLAIGLLLCGCSVQVTGIYSSMHYITSGENISGVEILVLGGDRGEYFAVLQCANGAPGKPVVVSATVLGDEIELAANNDKANHCPMKTFKGVVGSTGMVGSFLGGPELSLARRDSYWQKATGS